MDRRDFIKKGAAAFALAGLPPSLQQLAEMRKRVGPDRLRLVRQVRLLRLVQVAPVEVVSLCDVDQQMLAEAADLVATRQVSKKKPRTYGDYREMLQREGPRHRADRHARPLARAADDRGRASRGSTSTCRSRSASTSSKARRCWPRRASTTASCRSARSGAARRTWSRRATASSARASSARSAWSRSTATTTCARRDEPARHAPPDYLDYEMWTGPAPMRPYNALVHPRSWRAFMEYGNGIVGDMCVHMLDMVRWMLDLGMADAHQLVRRHPRRQGEQGEHHRHADRDVRLRRPAGGLDAPHLGRRARSEVSVGRHLLRRQGHAEGERDGLRFHPARGRASRVHKDVTYELEQYPGGQDREGSRDARRAGHPRRT